jgi:SPP1 family predicted phage head-tail adaptor
LSLPKTPSGVRRKSATDYNCQVSFLSGGDVDNYGNIAAPAAFCTVWANIKALQSVRGAAILKPDQILQKTNYMVVIRYRNDITESMVMQFNGKNFSIDSIGDPDGRGVELTMICSEVDETI